MTRRRVLFVDLAPSPGGSLVSLLQLATHLDPARFEPAVVLSELNPVEGFEVAGLPVARVPTPQWQSQRAGVVSRVQAGKMGDSARRSRWLAGPWHLAGDLRRYRREVLPATPPLQEAIRRFQPDIVHLNDNLSLNRASALAARRARLPALCHCRSFDPPVAIDRRWLAPGIAGWIFISQAVAHQQQSLMALRAPQRVIPNAVDLVDFDDPVGTTDLRSQLGIPPGAPLVGMMGRITPWKGQQVFLAALALLVQHQPAVHGVIVGAADEGDGLAYLASLQEVAASAGLAQRLHFAGPRRDVPAVLAALDVLVHCSVRPEPFGRVIIEGMAAARPVVASAAGGALEIVTPGVDGLLTAPGDPQALADALTSLLADPDLRARMGQQARQTVAQRYRIETQVEAVQDFYDQVLATCG